MPDVGLFMKTYVSVYLKGNDLVKYASRVNAVRKENGVTEKSNSSSTFYFDDNKLIKVEETANFKGENITPEWYYLDDKPLYYTVQSENSESRGTLAFNFGKDNSK